MENQGATEWVLNDATTYTTESGTSAPLTEAVRKQIADHVLSMADRGETPHSSITLMVIYFLSTRHVLFLTNDPTLPWQP